MTVTFRLAAILADMGDTAPNMSELARRTGLDIKTVRAIRDSTATRVDLATLDALATALGCRAGDLLDGPGKRVRRPAG